MKHEIIRHKDHYQCLYQRRTVRNRILLAAFLVAAGLLTFSLSKGNNTGINNPKEFITRCK